MSLLICYNIQVDVWVGGSVPIFLLPKTDVYAFDALGMPKDNVTCSVTVNVLNGQTLYCIVLPKWIFDKLLK